MEYRDNYLKGSGIEQFLLNDEIELNVADLVIKLILKRIGNEKKQNWQF
jgi:hypothetical protein